MRFTSKQDYNHGFTIDNPQNSNLFEFMN